MRLLKLIKILNITLVLVVVSAIFILGSMPADDGKEDQIKITLFKAHNDFAQSEIFMAKQPIVFYVLWSIPEGVVLKGKAVLTVEGERINGEKWIIKKKKKLRSDFLSNYWGWDCYQKIPKNAKPGSVGTATVELSIEGHETVREILTFNVEK